MLVSAVFPAMLGWPNSFSRGTSWLVYADACFQFKDKKRKSEKPSKSKQFEAAGDVIPWRTIRIFSPQYFELKWTQLTKFPSRKKHAPIPVRPITLKVRDQRNKNQLSDEDREALFAKLPFLWVSTPKNDASLVV